MSLFFLKKVNFQFNNNDFHISFQKLAKNCGREAYPNVTLATGSRAICRQFAAVYLHDVHTEKKVLTVDTRPW